MAAGLRAAVPASALRRVQTTWTAAAVGGWTFMVAFAVYAYQEGGASAVGVAALARMLPAGIVAPVTGVLADRHSRHDVLIAACLARGAVLIVMATAVAVSAPFVVVLVLGGVFTVLMTAHRPAHAALLPQLATSPPELAAANAVTSSLDNVGFMCGALLGGTLVAATSVGVALAAAAAAFALGALAMVGVHRDPVPTYREQRRGTLAELGDGVRAVLSHRELRLVFGVASSATLVEGAIDVLVVITAFAVLDLGGGGVGWLNAAWGVGGFAGGAAALLLLRRGRLAAGLAGGGLVAGLALLVFAALPRTAVAIAALLAVGLGYSLIEVAGRSLLQRLASDEVLGRTGALIESAYWIAMGLGGILAPRLVDELGARGAIAVTGSALPVLVLARWVALARLEAGRPVPERIYRRLRGLSLFAAVPPAVLEGLALRSREHRFPAGQVVMREGDPGDCFYAIDHGRLAISRGATVQAFLVDGDFVGEMALLRDEPRSATATVVEDAVLFALERDDFVAAVTGQPRARQAADAVMSERSSPARVA